MDERLLQTMNPAYIGIRNARNALSIGEMLLGDNSYEQRINLYSAQIDLQMALRKIDDILKWKPRA
jgi:hypothetical protein